MMTDFSDWEFAPQHVYLFLQIQYTGHQSEKRECAEFESTACLAVFRILIGNSMVILYK